MHPCGGQLEPNSDWPVALSTILMEQVDDEQYPELNVIIPVYDNSRYMPGLFETLWNQTYPNLKLTFSVEPSEDADKTLEILEQQNARITQKTNIRRLEIYRQKHRLYYTENMNFLLSKVTSHFYSYMQCDDKLSANYYEALMKCLRKNPKAVNCYPGTLFKLPEDKHSKQYSKRWENVQSQHSVVGSDYVRVQKVVLESYYIPNRGVVRVPKHCSNPFTYPRLYKAFTSADIVLMVKMAIAGELIAVDDAIYYKLVHEKALHITHLYNTTVFSTHDFVRGMLDEYGHKYNLAHSYVASSEELAKALQNRLGKRLQNFLPIRSQNQVTKAEAKKVAQEAAYGFWKKIQQPKRVAILGAGIQGCIMALMFRKHGYDVTVIDRAPDVMVRTSATGEGRIHLGLEYANDPSMTTAQFMLKSALRFSQYIEYLVGRKLDWSQLKSERLTCLLPHTSHVTPGQFEQYGKTLDDMYESELAKHPELSYLGELPPKVLMGRTKVPKSINASYINAAYDSIEVCVLSNKLRDIFREALYNQGVNLVFGRTILDVMRNNMGTSAAPVGKLRVVSDVGAHDYDKVVNCLWEGRAAIDFKMGLNHRVEQESYRVKANVRLPNLPKFHTDIPSVSVMNGPFGDFVRYGNDDYVYFAWHPISPNVITHNVTDVQEEFSRHVVSDFPPGYEQEVIDGHRKAFQALFPGYDTSFFDQAIVGTGYVVANGLTDIDDPQSGLHKRNDPPNLISDGYISVKTQKLTNAPYNAYLLEQELFGNSSPDVSEA